MATSKAGQKAVNKYVKANYDRINVTMKKGSKKKLQEIANLKTEGSINKYIKNAIKNQYLNDTNENVDL